MVMEDIDTAPPDVVCIYSVIAHIYLASYAGLCKASVSAVCVAFKKKFPL